MPLTRRALVRGGLAALAGLVFPSRALAAPLSPADTRSEPELDPDWRRANDEYWAQRRAFEAGNAAYWHNLHPAPPAPPAPEPAVTVAAVGPDLAAFALDYLGVPYVWGGATPAGWDCSGFVQWVCEHFGVWLPRTAAEQFSVGEPVGQPTAGDLVFFANTDGPGITHVGIALGNGAMVNAANERVGTITSDITSGYWAQHYAGARRVR